MARDKWSLPEMAKITDQRLVWLVIALCGGILLADFVPLHRAGLAKPSLLALFGLLLAGLTAWLVTGRSQGAVRAGFALTLAVLAGLFFARLEWARHASPQLAEPQTVSFSGQIEAVLLTSDGRSRLRVSQLTPPPAAWVAAMRVWANAAMTARLAASGSLVHGARIEGRARLFPLSGPLLAGSAEYGRQLWLSGIGATGYLLRAEASAPQIGNLALHLDRLRHAIADRLLKRMGHPAGPIAAALLVGVRDQMDETVYDWFRSSGLGAACRQPFPILSAEKPGWPCRNDTPPIEARQLRRGETYLIYLDREGQFVWQASPDSRFWLPWRNHLHATEQRRTD